ncbi:MAG: hypothetical protein GKR90_15590 [Pseudomonadales bacterium]|nr:hypothetical protein [Pseudomonadales bacterium]
MVYDVLPTNGQFVFSVPHPFFSFVRPEQSEPFNFDGVGKNCFAGVNEQFEGQIWKHSGEPLHVQCVHKTVSDSFDSLTSAGFAKIPEMKELTVTPELVAEDEAFFTPLLNQPLHLLFNVLK